MTAELHDDVELARPVSGLPVGTRGTVVIVYADGGLCVELDDPEMAPSDDGTIDVAPEDVTVLPTAA